MDERISSEHSLQYARLRRSYDQAFRRLIREAQKCPSSANPEGQLEGAEAAIEAAANSLRCERDRIADFLLKNPNGEALAHRRVQVAAYFLWLNAGCPNGTSVSDWLQARQHLAV